MYKQYAQDAQSQGRALHVAHDKESTGIAAELAALRAERDKYKSRAARLEATLTEDTGGNSSAVIHKQAEADAEAGPADLYKQYAQDSQSQGRAVNVAHGEGPTSVSQPVHQDSEFTSHVMVLSGRSQKKWDDLDVDQSGLLEGDEARLCPGTQAMLPGAD